MNISVYVSGYFETNIELPIIPNKDDRLVLSDNRYKGYIVQYREFVIKENKNEINLHCKEDK